MNSMINQIPPQKQIDLLKVKLLRKNLQCGLSNEEFGENITDWRLQHHIPTQYAKRWKNYKSTRRDSKYTDLVSECGNYFAEGKKLTGAACFCPSSDTGAGRLFNQENLESCFRKNSYYFLYDREYDEEYITFLIYWIPTEYIREWYTISGNSKGSITQRKLITHINTCEISETLYDITNQ